MVALQRGTDGGYTTAGVKVKMVHYISQLIWYGRYGIHLSILFCPFYLII